MGRNMEDGKRLALRHATGDYICFMDADNEVTHPDYFELAIQGLIANPQALGVESYYLPSPKMTSFCRYITSRLHISDPVSWLMTKNPKLGRAQRRDRTLDAAGQFTCSYPLGANGFFYRRQGVGIPSRRMTNSKDTHVALFLMQRGQREWLRVRGRGVHHYLHPIPLALHQETPPGHGPFPAGAGGDAGQLDEGKTAGAPVASGGLLFFRGRPPLAYRSGIDSRW